MTCEKMAIRADVFIFCMTWNSTEPDGHGECPHIVICQRRIRRVVCRTSP
jgi:hypothetical protein